MEGRLPVPPHYLDDSMSATATHEVPSQYLSFFLAGEEYGVGILRVIEIRDHRDHAGVKTTPIIDLPERFGLPSTAAARGSCVVIVELLLDGEPATIGLAADAVGEVVELAPDAVEPAPSFGTAVGADYLDGMALIGRRFVMLLNVDRALSAQGRSLDRMESERSVAVSAERANG
jgi:purine-binding chemotaxis protein CheW